MTFKHEAVRPSTTWILVADRARAKLFAGEWPELSDFHEIEDFAHPEGGAHQRDVESDRPGLFRTSNGGGSAASDLTDFVHRTATEFARELVDRLQHGKDTNAYGRLVIIAPAMLLRLLRDELPAPLTKLLVADLDKDLTHQNNESIQAHVRDLLALPSGQT